MTIKQKQWQLRLLGYYTGNIDGIFGPKSESATLAFQKDFFPDKIAWDGIFGPNTEEKTKEIVDAIQDVVTAYVSIPLVNDGLAGAKTEEAVRAYQEATGLPVTGIVNAETYEEIRQWVGPVPNTTPNKPAEDVKNDQLIWNFLIDKGFSAAGAAGLMGNLEAESVLKPTNLQNTYEAKLGYTDESYTNAVDSGAYTNFANDCAGYGLAQWTYHTRKAALLTFCKESGRSIGSLDAQLEFLYKELSESYKSLLNTLKTTSSIKEASDLILTQFERPADMSDSVKEKRAAFGQAFFERLAYPPVVEESDSWWDEIEYVTPEECKCKCGGRYCNGYPAEMKEGVVRIADNARKHFGRPVHIVSGLRCQIHNANEGGVANSQHMYGEAIDMRIDGTSADQLLAFVQTQPHRYAYKINGTNVHVDIPKGSR